MVGPDRRDELEANHRTLNVDRRGPRHRYILWFAPKRSEENVNGQSVAYAGLFSVTPRKTFHSRRARAPPAGVHPLLFHSRSIRQIQHLLFRREIQVRMAQHVQPEI